MKKVNTRHGEVFIQKVTKAPKGKTEKHTSFVVGHSESGAHHVLESDTAYKVITTGGVDKQGLFIRLMEPARLVHKKTINRHKDLVVEKGTYKIIRKQEYSPFLEAMTNVFD